MDDKKVVKDLLSGALEEREVSVEELFANRVVKEEEMLEGEQLVEATFGMIDELYELRREKNK